MCLVILFSVICMCSFQVECWSNTGLGHFFYEKPSLTFCGFLYDFPWLQTSKSYNVPWLIWENIYLSLTQVLELKLEETPLTWKWFINLSNTLIETKKKINSGEKTNWFYLYKSLWMKHTNKTQYIELSRCRKTKDSC